MKRYCKNIDITDINIIKKCIYDCLDGKWRRKSVANLLSKHSDIPAKHIIEIILSKDYDKLSESIDNLAKSISQNIILRRLELPPIQWFTIEDSCTGKIRDIGKESILHQIYNYIAVYGIKDMCTAKIGYSQCACVPERGQVYGKNIIEKWLRKDIAGTKYCLKMDIKKCYPSIDKNRLLSFLKRDIKNDTLLWLLEKLIDMFDKGLSIGSYLSQWLCNYYLSYAYHYAVEQLAVEKTRRGVTKRTRLVNHVLFYMDDIIFLGGNKRDLMKAFNLFSTYLDKVLGLTIKSSWRLFRVQYTDKYGKSHGSPIDIMGFKFYRDHTTVRRRTFFKFRRKILIIEKCIRYKEAINKHLAENTVSLYGWLKNCDCYKFLHNHREAVGIARKAVSYWNKHREE